MTIPADTTSNSTPEWFGQIQRQARIARWAAFVLLGWMFLPLVTGRVYVCDDLLNYHLPIRQFYADCLKNGDAFDWMPSLFSGFFLTGSGQAGTYHPWHWLLYRILPLQTAFNLEILSTYPFMLFGMKLFLQRHLKRPDAAWLGAIVFTFSGFCTLHFLHPNAVAVVSHIPWLLLAHDLVLGSSSSTDRNRKLAETGICLLTGSQILLGYPQYVWFSLLAEAVYCLGFVSASTRGLRTLLFLAVLKSLGLALGAIQILPSVAALAESDRTSMPPEYFFQHPLTAADMLQWIHPFLTKSRVFGVNTHELGLYCGAIPLLLSFIALIRIRTESNEKRLTLVFLLLGFIALWLSFGKAGGLYILQTWMPMIGKFRWPSRILVLLHLAVAVLSAVGYVRLTSGEKATQLESRVLVLVPCLSVAALLGVLAFYRRELIASGSLLIIGPVLFILAAFMLRDLSQGKFSAAMMIFVAGDLAAYGFTYEALSNTQTMSQIIAALQPPPGSPNDGRIIAETQISDHNPGFGGNELLLAGWKQADGYEGLLPQMHLLDSSMSLQGLRISGVRWVINAGHHSKIEGLIPTSDSRWLEVPDPLPRIRLTNQVRTVLNVSDAVAALSANGPVVIDSELSSVSDKVIASGSVRMLRDRPGLVQIEVQSNVAQLLVLSERKSSGWKATVDGKPTPIIAAEVDFMGCEVPAGIHQIQFIYQPVSLQLGRWISLSAGLLLLAGAVLRTRKAQTTQV